jgi:DNA polymerase
MQELQKTISLSPSEKAERLKRLRTICYSCTSCSLCHNRPPVAQDKKPYVFGAGKVGAKVVFVGQNPGLTEVEIGRPFVGASGRVLDLAFKETNIDRRMVYITNGVLCYTMDNAVPPNESVESCRQYLEKQLDIIRPDAVVVMGKSAARSFGFGDQFSVSMCRANRPWKTELHSNVYFTVHPAYTIYSKGGFDLLTQTFNSVKDLIR